MKTYPVMTAIGTLEVLFVDATRACVWTPNGATVTVGKGTYTANVSFNFEAGTWNHVATGQSAPLLSRLFPDLRPVPPTVATKLVETCGVALRAILEEEPAAPDLAELAYAEQAVQRAQKTAEEAHAQAAEADQKLADARRRLRLANLQAGKPPQIVA